MYGPPSVCNEHQRHLPAQVGRALRKHQAAFQQEPADLIDERGAPAYQPFTHAVQCLQIELIVGFDGHETHVVSRDGFGDRFGIDVVVLVDLAIGLHELRGNEFHFVALIAQLGSEKVRTGAGLCADQRPGQVRREGQQLRARELLADNNSRVTIESDEVKDSLTEIDTDGSNSSVPAMILRFATSGNLRVLIDPLMQVNLLVFNSLCAPNEKAARHL